LINKPEYSVGVYVVLLISIAELIKLSLGTNGTILTNSKYYRMLFYFSIAMAVSVIVLNRVLITYFGIQGAALATLLVVVLFSLVKVVYVRNKLKMHPYSRNTKKILIIIIILFAMFYFVELNINAFLSILIKSFLLVSVFVFLIVKLKLSEDINNLYHKYILKK
jgi:O-antigen/teichoic acid export membrane protein